MPDGFRTRAKRQGRPRLIAAFNHQAHGMADAGIGDVNHDVVWAGVFRSGTLNNTHLVDRSKLITFQNLHHAFTLYSSAPACLTTPARSNASISLSLSPACVSMVVVCCPICGAGCKGRPPI